MPPKNLRRKAEDLLRQSWQLKETLTSFERSAQAMMPALRKVVPPAEDEVMASPRANVLGTLEVLLNSDFPGVLRQLDEMEGYLQADPEMKAYDEIHSVRSPEP